jgi:hypothetical protein
LKATKETKTYCMKPTNDLFDLIHALTKSEKRFFKLQSSLQNGEKNYVRLFDAIEKMSQYDEQELKEIFKGEVFLKHLPSEKNHLFKLILKSLRSYHSENNASSLIKLELKNVEILFEKGLFDECRKSLKKSKKIAVEYEFYFYHFEIISWEKRLIEEEYENGEFEETTEGLALEETLVLEKLRNLAAYQQIYGRVNGIFKLHGYCPSVENEGIINELLNSSLIQNEEKALSIRSKCIRLYSIAFAEIGRNEIEKAVVSFEKCLEIFDQNEWLRLDKAKRYFRTLSNYLMCKIIQQDKKTADAIYERIQNEMGRAEFQGMHIQVFGKRVLILAQIERALTFNLPIDIDSLMTEVPESNSLHANKEFELMFNFRVALVFFSRKEFQRALRFVNYVINEAGKDLRQDIYGHVRVLNIFVHYNLNNDDVVEYAIKSLIRFYNGKTRDHADSIAFLKTIRQAMKLKGDETKKSSNQRLLDVLPAPTNIEDHYLLSSLVKGMS